MHRHVIAISNRELVSIKEAWETHPDSINGKINIMLALVNSDNDKQSIIVVDRIKLATLTFTLATDGKWWSIIPTIRPFKMLRHQQNDRHHRGSGERRIQWQSRSGLEVCSWHRASSGFG